MDNALERQHECAVKIGRQVRLLRKARGWTQGQLAERASLSNNFIGQVERAEETISLNNLIVLADALNVSLVALLSPCGDKPSFVVENMIQFILKNVEKISESDVLTLYNWMNFILSNKKL